MMSILTFFLLLMNSVFSGLTAYSIGRAWVETKHCGGWFRWSAWMGAAASAVGFTWSYWVILVMICIWQKWLKATDINILLPSGYWVTLMSLLFVPPALSLARWASNYRETIGSVPALEPTFYQEKSRREEHPLAVIGASIDIPHNSTNSSGGNIDLPEKLVFLLVLAAFAIVGGILTTVAIIKYAARQPLVA